MAAFTNSVNKLEGEQDPIPPLASFEDLQNDYWRCGINRDIRRLRWSLDGPLNKAVLVMHRAYYDPNDPPPEPFYCPRSDNNNLETWHPISALLLLDPKVTSVTISVTSLQNWAFGWSEVHLECPDQNEDQSSEIHDENESSDGKRSTCCGQKNPIDKDVHLTINASTEGGYVTIRDYVAAVHPWLMGLRDDLLMAGGRWEENIPLPPDTEFMVSPEHDWLDTIAEEEWLIEFRSNPFPEHPSPPTRVLPLPSLPPDTTPMGGVDPRMLLRNKTEPPLGLLDAHCWPGI